MIRGVIFDMDGLMLDTEKLLARFWMQAAREAGFPMELEHVLGIRSLADHRQIRVGTHDNGDFLHAFFLQSKKGTLRPSG